MRRRLKKTPLVNIQVPSQKDGDGKVTLKQKSLADKMSTILKLAEDAGLYHVDGDEQGEEALHFEFMLVEPEMFMWMASRLGMNLKDVDEYPETKD